MVLSVISVSPKVSTLSLKRADDGEGDSLNREVLADGGIGTAEHFVGKGHCNDGAHEMTTFVLVVEEAAGEKNEVAHVPILRAYSQNQGVFDYAAAEADAIVGFKHGGRELHAGNLGQHGSLVLDG